MHITIECLTGSLAGQVFTFDQPDITLGRGEQQKKDVDFADTDIGVSRNHGQLAVRDQRVFFIDQSRGGTLARGQRVQNSTLELRPGDELQLGGPSGPRLRVRFRVMTQLDAGRLQTQMGTAGSSAPAEAAAPRPSAAPPPAAAPPQKQQEVVASVPAELPATLPPAAAPPRPAGPPAFAGYGDVTIIQPVEAPPAPPPPVAPLQDATIIQPLAPPSPPPAPFQGLPIEPFALSPPPAAAPPRPPAGPLLGEETVLQPPVPLPPAAPPRPPVLSGETIIQAPPTPPRPPVPPAEAPTAVPPLSPPWPSADETVYQAPAPVFQAPAPPPPPPAPPPAPPANETFFQGAAMSPFAAPPAPGETFFQSPQAPAPNDTYFQPSPQTPFVDTHPTILQESSGGFPWLPVILVAVAVLALLAVAWIRLLRQPVTFFIPLPIIVILALGWFYFQGRKSAV